MGKVKVRIVHDGDESLFYWDVTFRGKRICTGVYPEDSAKRAGNKWLRFARRLRVPDDAWEFVEADNG